ncbi:MAG: hypothetical protein ABW000_14815 [Actinoplanes sp.]
MSLTSTPLIVLAVLGAIAALTATIVVRIRGRRLRILLRSLGVLLTEALLLLSVGLFINRSEQFYPTWAALLQSSGTTATSYATAPGRLDQRLRADAGGDLAQSVTFTWQTADWTGWQLAGAPTIVTPTEYLEHPGWRYSVVLVIDDGTGGWTPAGEATAARSVGISAGPAVMLFARTTAATTAKALTTDLPAALARDLRVTGRRWAMVASGSDAVLARQSIAAAPGRIPAIAFVGSVTRQSPSHATVNPRPSAVASGSPAAVTAGRRPNQTGDGVTVLPPRLPAGIAVAVVGGTTPRPSSPGASTSTAADRGLTAEAVHLAAGTTNGLETALAWAGLQTPPPLAASTSSVTYVPLHLRPQRGPSPSSAGLPPVPGSATAGSAAATTRPGGNHATGQPGS